MIDTVCSPKMPGDINITLECHNNADLKENNPLLTLKAGDSLRVVPLEFLKGQVRFQVERKGSHRCCTGKI